MGYAQILGRPTVVTQDATWIPEDIDTTVPSVARIYDYALGGAHNFAADRALAKQLFAMDPGFQDVARVTRAAMGRMVRFMIDSGIRQFLDIGSGIPTAQNVHEIAQGIDPGCRIVYVDIDPIAVAHSELMLLHNDRADVLHTDLRRPDSILSSPQVTRQLNMQEPIGLMFMMVLHWISDGDGIDGLMQRYRDAVPSGSYLGISHVGIGMGAERKEKFDTTLHRSGNRQHLNGRTATEVAKLFGDFDLVEPGLVPAGQWRSEFPPVTTQLTGVHKDLHAGLARKP
ncbi:hypothetical protein D5S17_18445 [Pseudonocardiaceae bacterium YIM PH 21723]|nr:hypothetical protein D5S17_18445 [Pseudonocardiaceae bacterium YIM PH 21723]